jgi:hypothetical protein
MIVGTKLVEQVLLKARFVVSMHEHQDGATTSKIPATRSAAFRILSHAQIATGSHITNIVHSSA